MMPIKKANTSTKEKKVSYYGKETYTCPICNASFKREEMFSGRVNAGDLTDELHRTYIPMAAYGVVNPLIYEIEVCPSCFFASFRSDFMPIAEKFTEIISDNMRYRIDEVQKIFPHVDFLSNRTLFSGAASYYLALMCYSLVTSEYAPNIKSAVISLRLAWLCTDLDKQYPEENWAYVARVFYNKARFYYKHAIELEQNGKEPYSNIRFALGPDTDKNYGHEGVLYCNAILELKYGPHDNSDIRRKNLEYAKSAVARMFGFGKKNKSKPGPLLEKAKELYDKLKAECKDSQDEDDFD